MWRIKWQAKMFTSLPAFSSNNSSKEILNIYDWIKSCYIFKNTLKKKKHCWYLEVLFLIILFVNSLKYVRLIFSIVTFPILPYIWTFMLCSCLLSVLSQFLVIL